jgi:CheY-like chemotaxis protein
MASKGTSPKDSAMTADVVSEVDCSGIDLHGVKVLVVDDEADARHLIERLLREAEADVIVAESAARALELVGSERPDVLVSDIGMPGVDGYQLIREIRALSAERGGRIPAVALTAFARSEDRKRAMRAGYQLHVSKPIESRELIVTIASLVARGR